MNELFEEFALAHASRNGYAIAQTLSPVPPPDKPHKLAAVWQSTNAYSVKGDIKHFIKHNYDRRSPLEHHEVNGWVEVYTAYWRAVGEIVSGENGNVSFSLSLIPGEASANQESSHPGPKCTMLGKSSPQH